MRSYIRFALIAMLGAATVSPALAQGTITDGTASFDWNSFGALGASVDFNVAGVDHAFVADFWGRTSSMNSEVNFGTPTSQAYNGDFAIFGYDNLFGISNLHGVVRTFIDDLVANQAAVISQRLRITNNTGNRVVLSIYHYLDLDLSGIAGDDSAVLDDPNLIRMNITDGSAAARYLGFDANAYQVDAFPNLRNLLTDGDVDNFNDTGLPFGPGDWTGGYQWNFVLENGDSRNITVGWNVNVPVPAPGGLAVLGLSMMLHRGRRRAN
jgi:hypothetical protein